ncbi:MAG: endopeptidase La, partial [Thiotrichales bacterium]|nr:endopeptidase La [Thiotrichales bacterium]
PIGGLKEKLLAAHRGGINIVMIPEENRKDLKEIPEKILKDLEIKPVQWIDEVLGIALQHAPEPLSAKEVEKDAVAVEDAERKLAEESSSETTLQTH